MNIKEYSNIIEKTAVYPRSVENFGKAYCMLGLMGEFTEFQTELSKGLNKDTNFDKLVPSKAVIKEYGDVIWYLTALSSELGFSLDEVFSGEMHLSDQILEALKKEAIAGGATTAFISFYGRLSEIIKKDYRDARESSEESNEEIKQLLTTLGKSLTALAYSVNINIKEALELNYKKLIKRRETNTLHGSGDDREEKQDSPKE